MTTLAEAKSYQPKVINLEAINWKQALLVAALFLAIFAAAAGGLYAVRVSQQYNALAAEHQALVAEHQVVLGNYERLDAEHQALELQYAQLVQQVQRAQAQNQQQAAGGDGLGLIGGLICMLTPIC